MFKGLEKIRDGVNTVVNESTIPTTDYKSTVGVYGGKIKMTENNKMVWDNSGFISKIDKWGDAILRTYDEHLVKNLKELFLRHPRLFFRFLAPGTKRYRGNKEEIMENIEKLGLDNIYASNEKGIEIKDKSVYQEGVILQDIFRADIINSNKLKDLDRFQAVSETGNYLRSVHDSKGAIGEVLVSDIIFRKKENNHLSEATLNIPDIVYNQDKNIGDREKKATDLLDLLISIGAEEFRVSAGDIDSVKKIMKVLLKTYNDKYVIALAQSYIKRGRLVLSGDVNSKSVNIPTDSFTTKNRALFSIHNEARVVKDKDLETRLKDICLSLCEEFAA